MNYNIKSVDELIQTLLIAESGDVVNLPDYELILSSTVDIPSGVTLTNP